jgi:hypothetical protein
MVFDFWMYLHIHTPKMIVLISWDCQKSEIINSMMLEVQKAHDVDSMSIRNLHSVEIVADIWEKYIYIYWHRINVMRLLYFQRIYIYIDELQLAYVLFLVPQNEQHPHITQGMSSAVHVMKHPQKREIKVQSSMKVNKYTELHNYWKYFLRFKCMVRNNPQGNTVHSVKMKTC